MLGGLQVTNDVNATDSRPGAGGPGSLRQTIMNSWDQVMGLQPAWAQAAKPASLTPPTQQLTGYQGPSFSAPRGLSDGPSLGEPMRESAVQGPVNFGIAPTNPAPKSQHTIPALISALRGMRS